MNDKLFSKGRLDSDATPEKVGDYLTAHKWLPLEGRKTPVWSIFIANGRQCIGYVEWYSRWRRFCFFPRMAEGSMLLFDSSCLCSLMTFLDNAYLEYRGKTK